NCTRCHTPDCLASRSAAPTLPISNPVFGLVGEIGMRWPKRLGDRWVIFRACVFVANQHCDRRPKRFSLKNAGKNFATIFFFPLRCDSTLTRATAIELALNLCFRDVDLRRTTIDHDANAAAVRFPERRDPKKLTERVTHRAEKLSQHR